MDEILTGESPVVRLAQGLLEQAVVDRASDLHIEPSAEGVVIRMRVDGILHDVLQAPLATLRPLVSRMKVMGGLDIAESRLPQDGRFSLAAAESQDRRANREHSDGDRRSAGDAIARPAAHCGLDQHHRVVGARHRTSAPGGTGRPRCHLRHWTNRLRQVVNGLRRRAADQHARAEHHLGRGPGRVSRERAQADSDQPARRLYVSDGAALGASR